MTALRLVFCLLLSGGALAAAESARPRYIFFNIAPSSEWNEKFPDSITRGIFDDVKRKLPTPENSSLRVGVSFIFNTLETPTNVLAAGLRRFLECSRETEVPILITLDGQNWWQSRSDLWNWWDPQKPGYNPSNVFNVEWTGWSPTQAVKISWRNWGSQLRVAPAQNLASPRVINEQLTGLRTLLPIITNWYQSLPADKRWLFGGVKVGWEAGVGYNAYYYPNGNQYLEQWPHDWSHDPKHLLHPARDLAGGASQSGYAAVLMSGLKDHGKVSRDDIARVTGNYLELLCREANASGLPPELVFTHQGGNYEPWEKHLPFWPAINRWSTPGWSFYGLDPRTPPSLAKDMETAGRQQWAACEWWWGGADAAAWEDHFRRTLSFKDCRFICVYNWNRGKFENDTDGLEAVRRLMRSWRD